MATEPQTNPGKPRPGPSDRLITMFRACSRDPTEAIKTRLKHMLHTFLQHHRENAGNEKTKEVAAKCCCEAVIWYYRILENLVSEERTRLGISDVSGILENDLVQRCLVACCLEITIFSNHLPCDFPLLLQMYKLAPYHFWRVIELVLRAQVKLSHTVASHLAQLEEKILESLAWTSTSPLWEEVRANEGHLHTCQQVIPPTQIEDPKKTEMQSDGNQPGAGVSVGADLSASTEQQCSPSSANSPQRHSSLHLFARKVYSLMGQRLRELCSTLNISAELRLKIWTCFEYSLVHFSCLMVDRHLDQLLMCAIYIIAKITKMEIPFKHIMKCYKSQPLANKSVCKSVLISDRDMDDSPFENNNNGEHSDSILTPSTPSTHYAGACQEERGNLIYFYNQVYIAKLQHFAKEFSATSGVDTPPLSPYPRQWKTPPCRQRLFSSHSIYISPYNRETSSPRTAGLCYYFSSSPPERLQEINNMIKTGRSVNRRCRVASLDKKEEPGDDGPSVKRLRVNDQSALERRLRNVVNDRVTGRN
ncbi:retinoblastoma-like protein 2 isoform X2 [Mastacembelus armatus]|nr:retinoblastoma-like protein 2 isoform X2 [Mastacembelus armatus]XP_026149989.1 retinoblastoma-like protein 2 isoform X2 [Mastacembelus armatus]XP_026149990.1 retinoblastoma-like protein 2 isoform X2 [Mastacembelus armatus]XP_026149991.1 retinoblastoma-like protein 2 isoform X2 [Mastacembelus armatus]XP_026149992.1 retinoblastoma-like protein 2 isoform X2 [Mastacembelus armatus]